MRIEEDQSENQPESRFYNSDKEGALSEAGEINAAGGFAWVVPEYGDDMGHENVFWGYRLVFFSAPRVIHRGRRSKLEAGVGT